METYIFLDAGPYLWLINCSTGPAYQAIIRKSNGQINANRMSSFNLASLDGNAFGPVLYKEKQALTSDTFGWISTNVGSGTVLNGNLATVNWGSRGQKYYWSNVVLKEMERILLVNSV